MVMYYMLVDATLFEGRIRPALAASWQARSFDPCHSLCAALMPAAQAFAERYHLGADEPLLYQVTRGLSFDPQRWKLLAGEMLLFAASEVPEIQIAPDTLCCILAPEQYRAAVDQRERFAPIQQAHFGSRDLVFGSKVYRPDRAGLNALADVTRLAGYLESQHADQWTLADLNDLREVADETERAEELEFAREWFAELTALYQRAHERRQVVICEDI